MGYGYPCFCNVRMLNRFFFVIVAKFPYPQMPVEKLSGVDFFLNGNIDYTFINSLISIDIIEGSVM